MNKYLKGLLIFIWILLFGFKAIHPWSRYTHIGLTLRSKEHSKKISNALYLKFLFDKGDATLFSWGDNSKTLSKWMEYGADVEDASVMMDAIWSRSNNHFHNPLKSFNQAGLTDLYIPLPKSPLSLLVWAQNGSEQGLYPKGDHSWLQARMEYYSALAADNQTSREENFARTFQSLGHQVHLIQDAAVPDHARNDSHYEKIIGKRKYGSYRNIEYWLEDDKNTHFLLVFSQMPLSPLVHFDQVGENNLVPISHLVDYGVYNGANPSNVMEQGLAEYTNANFVSESTILTEGDNPESWHYFPYPKYSSTNLESLKMPYLITAQDGRQDYVTYLKKDKDGEIVNHFLKAGYLEKLLRPNDEQPPTELYKRTFYLDELCHKDYATMLVPRAVGYSAALIDYFFRGEIEITLPVSNSGILPPQKEGIYSLCIDSSLGFDKLSLMVRNVTENNEEMQDGTVTLVVGYRTCNGDPFVPNPPIPGLERKYITVDYPGEVDIPRDVPLRLNFDLSAKPIPVNAADVTLSVVFKGDLGAEQDNAVALGYKDIGEPTPVDFFNNSDRLCFNGNSVPYTDPDLFVEVDKNGNGKIDCDLFEIAIIPHKLTPQYLSFNGNNADANNYFYKFPEDTPAIQPGQSCRIYYLADEYPAQVQISMPVITEFISNPLIPVGDISNCHPFELNTIDKSVSFRNKIVWQSGDIYNHESSTIKTFRGINYFNILVHPNISVPVGMDCDVFK